ncbi:splicing factor YJU2 [Malaya genurostris]|uniref:splicing factor YJU2 n=1 Tax=Malaya genurostris TaxID=325434 RepID=UPI0026F3CA74|nr:splicing factor YJU2 [Malaya genurostris]XP_058464809.1 splicing factor YJU2 [Malaya genurostris]XP_058464810.1 splicing factor YJU2 [Malaya genurostris]XP_058464812.1 splicing factor YJU2 [Malaya genurostris]
MSERKVLNKYYPPDFDPSKIPRVKLPKNRQYTVRLMAPFNMRCVTCGEYIYKGKKFNARKEDVENEDYLGIRIYRFYIKCTRCLQEISFKTDPRNTDYEIEAGATRNFMALKLAEEQARREEEEAREEEATNPMKLLENRTQQSRNEIELLESLEELRDLNRRQQEVDYDSMLQQYDPTESIREREERLERQDEEYIKSIKFQSRVSTSTGLKRVAVEEIVEEIKQEPSIEMESKVTTESSASSSSIIHTFTIPPAVSSNKMKKMDNTISIGVRKTSMSNLVIKKIPNAESSTQKKEAIKPISVATTSMTSELQAPHTSVTLGSTDNNDLSASVMTTSNNTVSGLDLLGTYSDSDNSSDSNEEV